MRVWISVIAATLVIGPTMFIQSRLVSMYTKQDSGCSLQCYSFNMFRSLVIQGNRLWTSDWSQRLLIFSWFLFSLIISALYSGTLTAVLAIPAHERPIDYLEDLPRAVKDGYTLGVMEDSSNELLFREAESGIYKHTWDLFNHDDRSQSFVNSPATGIARVLSTKFVYIGPTTFTQSLAAKLGSQKFHFGRSSFYPQSIVVICIPGVPYQNVFTRLLLRMVEGGLVEKWKDDEIFTASGKDSDKEEVEISAITLTHMQLDIAAQSMDFALPSCWI
ncbi:glutamate receptor ionotropic, delta-1-like [Palaemon carinicauda]|uniref:glutamate receptor ionotropic, delta-1-like n=1 Tax=Palaemon carinicauda TaxID=392227 RepID=UPI0035B5C44C